MKRKRVSLTNDPVVAEVRAIRQAIWKEAGGTFEGLQRLLDREACKRRTGRARRRRTGAG